MKAVTELKSDLVVTPRSIAKRLLGFFARAFSDCALMIDRGSVKFKGRFDQREAYRALKN